MTKRKDPKVGTGKNQKDQDVGSILMKTLKTQLELNSLLQQMLERQSQKLRKLESLLQEKYKS